MVECFFLAGTDYVRIDGFENGRTGPLIAGRAWVADAGYLSPNNQNCTLMPPFADLIVFKWVAFSARAIPMGFCRQTF